MIWIQVIVVQILLPGRSKHESVYTCLSLSFGNCGEIFILWTTAACLLTVACLGKSNQYILDTLSDTFVKCYIPGPELSVDEAMVKYKGHVGGTVVMQKKPVKKGFKIRCCSCACCGYLCTFQVYHGRPTDLLTGRKVLEKGLAKRVVKDLAGPFVGLNHVIHCDNFYSSIFIAGTLRNVQKVSLNV